METTKRNIPFRLLVLIATPKLTDKASDIFHKGALPILYRLHGEGSASSEMMDMFGLGSPEKSILISMMPKDFATHILEKLSAALDFETPNSGIAFTIPLTGANNLILQMHSQRNSLESFQTERKEKSVMTNRTHTLIMSIVNRGFSSEVISSARTAGAYGGTIIHSRQIYDEDLMNFWGLNMQEEKEIILILAEVDHRTKIMHAITEKCGIHSEAKGIVMSLPVDTVIGLPKRSENTHENPSVK